MPVALGAYALSSTGRQAFDVEIGVWARFVLVVAIGGPIPLTLAGIVSLLFGRDEG